MEEKNNGFEMLTIENDADSAAPAQDGGRELEIFGEEKPKKNRAGRQAKLSALHIVIFILIGVLVGVAGTLGVVAHVIGGITRLPTVKYVFKEDTSVINLLLEKIENLHYGETPTREELLASASHALVDAVGDPYAEYYTEEEYDQYMQSFSGNYYGIGITVIGPDGTGALIKRVIEGSFAEKAGLLAGDLITAVDGTDVKNVSGSELLDLIKGESGTTVNITFLRSGKEDTVTVERGEVYIKRVDHFITEDGIGYISISTFSGNATDEFRAALDDLQEKGAKGLIVDLRNNPGGGLNIVVDICDMVLPDCTIVSIHGKTFDPAKYYKSDKKMVDLPMVVLVNSNSASASEIFAGAMQDNGRAKIIGVQTYGKGVVQTTYPLDEGHGWIKLTTDAYYTPNGTNLGGTGITPDIAVELPEELTHYDNYTLFTEHFDEDTQLQAAIKELG